MFAINAAPIGAIVRAFRSRSSLMFENLALRQHLAVLERKHPKPRIAVLDKLFWQRTQTGQALAHLLEEPLRSYRRHGLIRCADGHFPRALLFFRLPSRPALHTSLQSYISSDRYLSDSATTRSICVSVRYKVFDFRPRQRVWFRNFDCGLLAQHGVIACIFRNSVAERSRRAVDRKLPPRLVGPRHCLQRASLETRAPGVCPPLPRRPNAPRAKQRNS